MIDKATIVSKLVEEHKNYLTSGCQKKPCSILFEASYWDTLLFL